MLDKRILIIKDVITNPSKAFREIDANPNQYFSGALIILILIGIISSLGALVSGDLNTTQNEFEDQEKMPMLSKPNHTFSLIYGPISVAGNFLFIALVYWIGKRLKGVAQFKGIFSTMMYASVLSFFVSPLFYLGFPGYDKEITSPEEILSSLPLLLVLGTVAFAIGVWEIILTILACKESHKVSGKRAIGILLVSIIIVIIIVIPIGVAGVFTSMASNPNYYGL